MNEIIQNQFKRNETESYNMCNICHNRLNTIHKGNLTKHLKSMHKDKFIEIEEKMKKIEQDSNQGVIEEYFEPEELEKVVIYTSLKRIKDYCIEMVCLNGRPLQIVEDSGFKAIIGPIIGQLKNKKETINRRNLFTEIKSKSNLIRDQMKKTLKNKIVSIKVDIGSRFSISILGNNSIDLGINLQIIIDGSIRIYNIGMVRLTESHTAANLLNVIFDVLEK